MTARLTRPTISCCMTAGREPERVRAILALVRPFVDEIVLAVDDRATATLEACADLVDVGLRYAFEPPPARYIGWIHHQCRGDWILRLDDDEVPGQDLLHALRDLVADRRPTHLLLPWRHLFPTPDRWLASHPWTPDYHVRLLQNVPGAWSFAGRVHHEAEVLGEGRRVPAPVYHLNYVTTDLEDRRAKARRLESLDPGAMTEGHPVNALYLPEDWTGVETAPVPARDQPLIDAVLAPGPVLHRRLRRRRPAPLPPVTAVAEVDRYNTSRAVLPGAYRAEIAIADRRRRLAAGTVAHLEVVVRNDGDERWPAAHHEAPLIRVAYRWLAEDGVTPVVEEGLRTPFSEAVEPGQTTRVALAVAPPGAPGTYVLEVDVVHELVRWFGCTTRERFSVEPVGERPASAPEVGPEMARRRPPESGVSARG